MNNFPRPYTLQNSITIDNCPAISQFVVNFEVQHYDD